MSKSGKVLVVVLFVVLLAAVGGIFWLSNAMDDVGAVKIKTEDVPCGLEWGMTMEEVRAVMDGAGYIEQELDRVRDVICYRVPAYQGQYKARCNMLLHFSDKGALDWVHFRFEEEATEAFTITAETIDEVQAAFEKAYEKECEEVFIKPDPIAAYEYCLMEKSLVSFNRLGVGFFVTFKDCEAEDMPEYIEALREELK